MALFLFWFFFGIIKESESNCSRTVEKLNKMAEEEARAKVKAVLNRSGQRGVATRKIAEVKELLSAENIDLVKLGQIRATLEERIDALQ